LDDDADLRPGLRRRALEILGRLAPAERESLLIKCWMSHDARWFMAAAGEHGIEAANRLNRLAAHELGKGEARRIVAALGLPAVRTLDDYLLVQEVLIALLGPDLLDYRVTRTGPDAFQIHVRRCFAHDHAVRAGIAGDYDCGIFARLTGWLEALGLPWRLQPVPGRCQKALGGECLSVVSLTGAGERARAWPAGLSQSESSD
jgi:hypothetical protein